MTRNVIRSFAPALVLLSLLASEEAAADALCTNCEILWVDSEASNGDIRFGTVSGTGTGSCAGQTITTRSTVTDRQRAQILSILMAAAVSGKRVDAHGADSGCGSLTLVTLRAQ